MKEYIYIFRTFGKDASLIKIGYSSKVNERLYNYLSHNPLLEIILIISIEDAKEFESQFHTKHKSFLRKEWYGEDILPVIYKAIDDWGNIKNTSVEIINYKHRKADIVLKYIDVLNYYKKHGHFNKYDNINDHYRLNKYKNIILDSQRIFNKMWVNDIYALKKIQLYKKINSDLSLRSFITDKFKIDEYYTAKYINKILTNFYIDIGVSEKSISKHLTKYFNIKLKLKQTSINGKTYRMYKILKK